MHLIEAFQCIRAAHLTGSECERRLSFRRNSVAVNKWLNRDRDIFTFKSASFAETMLRTSAWTSSSCLSSCSPLCVRFSLAVFHLLRSVINPCQIPPSLFNKVLVFTFPLLSVYLRTNEWAAVRCGPQIKTAPRGLSECYLPLLPHTHTHLRVGPRPVFPR